jgi:hypothetical protein
MLPSLQLILLGTVDMSSVHYYIFKNGGAQEGDYLASEDWDTKLPGIEVIIMDDCSVTIDLETFTGVVIVAAAPSQFTKNLKRAIFRSREFCMPPVERDESIEMGKQLKVDAEIVEDNFLYTSGITRYLFERSAGKTRG